MAEGIRDAFADLFKVNKSAEKLSRNDLINKFKTLSQGQLSDSVLDKLAMTFAGLVKEADFSKPLESLEDSASESNGGGENAPSFEQDAPLGSGRLSLGGMHYNIQLILPDTRDPKVFDALFRSLREHLF